MGYIVDLSLDLVPIWVILPMFFNRTASNTNLINILTLYTSIASTGKPFQGIKIQF